jgi:hypothetical protein
MIEPCLPGNTTSPLTNDCVPLSGQGLFSQNPTSGFFTFVIALLLFIILMLLVTRIVASRKAL